MPFCFVQQVKLNGWNDVRVGMGLAVKLIGAQHARVAELVREVGADTYGHSHHTPGEEDMPMGPGAHRRACKTCVHNQPVEVEGVEVDEQDEQDGSENTRRGLLLSAHKDRMDDGLVQGVGKLGVGSSLWEVHENNRNVRDHHHHTDLIDLMAVPPPFREYVLVALLHGTQVMRAQA